MNDRLLAAPNIGYFRLGVTPAGKLRTKSIRVENFAFVFMLNFFAYNAFIDERC